MVSVWQEPIFDRTRKDVEFAITKIAEWIARGEPTDVYDLKGCLNVSDINRIEGNITYLSERLTEYAYPATVSTKKWTKGDLPTEQDIQRIIDNISEIINAFYQPRNIPPLPFAMLSYEDINSIERNIDLIKYLLDCMVSSFRKANAFKSGSKMFLPIRR